MPDSVAEGARGACRSRRTGGAASGDRPAAVGHSRRSRDAGSAPCSASSPRASRWSTSTCSCQRRAAVHRPRLSRRRPGVAVLGAERVRDRVRGAAGPGRPGGRPDRPPRRVPDRHGRLRAGLGRLRRRAGRLGAGRRPDRPGGRRRAAHARLARPAAGGGAAGAAAPARSAPGPRSAAPPPRSARSLGGALVEASWHWVFLVNVPVVAIAAGRGRAGAAARPRGRARGRAPGRRPARTSSAPRSSPSRSARSPSPWSRPTTGAGRRRRSLGGIAAAAVAARAVHPPVGPPPGPGHRAAPAAAPAVRHRHRGERGVRHRLRRDAAAGDPVVPGRLGLVRAADRARRRPRPAAGPVLGDRGRARSPAGSARARSPRPAARSTPAAASSGG